MGGDFNFIENAADTTGHMAGSSLTGDAKAAWARECDRLRLWDVVQDSHTRFQSGVGGGCSARLDRFYASFSNAERTLLHVDSHPVFAGVVSARCHASLHAGLVDGSLQPLIHRLSDHLPVGLGVKLNAPHTGGKGADVPAWVANVPGFSKRVLRDFGKADTETCPFKELDRWKATVSSVHKLIIQGNKELEVVYGGQTAKLTRAVCLLHLCTRTNPDLDYIRKLVKDFPFLAGMVKEDAPLSGSSGINTTELEHFIAGLYGDGIKDSAATAFDTSSYRPPAYLPGTGGGGTQPAV